MPERFGLVYTDSDNTEKTPVMIHRAILGSLERFMGILIEHYAGSMPAWLSPEQVRVLPISEKTLEYADGILDKLKEAGFRASCDNSNEKIGAKIAKSYSDKVPYMLVVGGRESESGQVSVRAHSRGDLGARPLDEFLIEIIDAEQSPHRRRKPRWWIPDHSTRTPPSRIP